MTLSDPFVAFDLETTGVDPFSDVPVSYAIVQPGFDCVGLVNPGRKIPEGASSIHGITDDHVKDSPLLADSVAFIVDTLNSLWQEGAIIVGMNVSYDLTMIDVLRRQLTNLSMPIGPILDVLVLDRHYDKWRKGKRNLTSLAKWYGVELTNAHSADADCYACLEILTKMRGRYPFNFSLKDNFLLREWYRDWLSGYSTYQEGLGKDPIPKGRYEWPVHSADA
ncbi:MAG TPA: exonuclease domain-containing protein [Candidatus Saccharimonadales bacterium]|jgi:DNA polymerase III epsilon subunit-like protein